VGHGDLVLKASIIVTLKQGLLDPQGKAIEGALKLLDIAGVESVRQGKIFEIELVEQDRAKAQDLLKTACEKLLANTIVENYRIELA
jgi:phosphoribosylformylglycinamidine synthase subunit PurS